MRVVILALALLGCRDVFVSHPGGTLTVDRVSYVAVSNGSPTEKYRVYRFTVEARFTNTSAEPISFERGCGQPQHSILDEGARTESYNMSCWSGYQEPAIVLPGQTRVDTIYVFGPTEFDNQGRIPSSVRMEGTFHLAYLQYFKSGNEPRFFSPPFEVKTSD